MSIILASGSPRRQELMQMIGVGDFTVMPAEVDEHLTTGASPEQTVCEIALAKARYVSHSCEQNDIIIAADTLVYLNDTPIGKPLDINDAVNMLRALSGQKHTVYTGVAILKDTKIVTFTEQTDVFFRKISEDEISAYVASGEPMDKAGAYGAQGKGSVFIEKIEGDFFNVMGLPLCSLSLMLRKLGVSMQ